MGRKGSLPEQLISWLPSHWTKSVPEAKQTLQIQTNPACHFPIYDLSQVKCFKAGNIHNHFSQWKSITSEPFIKDIVKSGLELCFADN